MGSDEYSDELINAHVDGELSPDESGQLLEGAQSDPLLAARLDEIRRLKDLVRHAYQQPPRPWRMGPATLPRQRWLRIAAALAVVAVASLTAWTFGHRQGAQALLDEHVVGSDWREPLSRAVAADEQRIVLHLASGDIERLRRSLDQAELILAGFEYSSHPPQVELIANGEGLNLFRTDTTPFAAQIEELRSSYPSLGLVACARGIERLRDAGIEVEILSGVDTGSVAIERIYTRMRQGWRYEEI